MPDRLRHPLPTITRAPMTPSTLTADEQHAVQRTLRLFEILRELDPNMPLGAAVSFLAIASRSETCVSDLKEVGVTRSPATYHAMYLGEDHDRTGKPGLGLVSSRLAGTDRRRRMLSLTPKGELLAGQIEAVMAR
jgi:hypothetical protein